MVKLVGYRQTGYRLWDPIKRKIIISREVRFNENESDYMTKEDNKKDSTKGRKNKINLRQEDYSDDDKELTNEEDNEDTEEEKENEEEDFEEEENEEVITVLESDEDNGLQEQTKNSPRRSQREKRFPDRYNTYSFLTYEEVMKSKDKDKWMRAIQEEKNSLEKNKTWQLVNTEEAKGKLCITSRWVFQIKEEGKYKARILQEDVNKEITLIMKNYTVQ